MLTTARVFNGGGRRPAFYITSTFSSAPKHNRISPLHRKLSSIPPTSEMSKPVEIQSVQQWNEIVDSSTAAGKTIVVDFHAVWCGPCKMIAPKYNQLASQNPQVQFLRVDVDEQPQISQTFRVSAMPTFFAIKSKMSSAWCANLCYCFVRGADPQGLARLVKEHAGPNPPISPTTDEESESTEATGEPTSRL
ncbi:thioredoxin-like protein [Mycena olivaceomarginata]|nr:thioredoxin-like protein [Mycena olivaceomarginata]